jgi:hypothetical protein
MSGLPPEDSIIFAARVALFHAVYGSSYGLSAYCRPCRRIYENESVVSFVVETDPIDKFARISCPKCNDLLAVDIIVSDSGMHTYLPLSRREAVITILLGAEDPFPTPDDFRQLHGEPFHWSLLFHFGSYRNAMSCKGATRYHDPLIPENWRPLAQPFIGRLPRSMIAHLVGVTSREVEELALQVAAPSQ